MTGRQAGGKTNRDAVKKKTPSYRKQTIFTVNRIGINILSRECQAFFQ
jgi:hypothetical protein